MKRKILAAAFLIFAVLGSAFGKEKILHAETKFFDIIFDETTTESARELYGCADEILEDLCLQYKIQPDFKIPVVITSRTETLNAYFTNYNYNHIVLYDTAPDESMMNSKRTIKSTFLHELNHLVSINAKNGFWRCIGKIFGDIYNPGDYITLTSFFKEGASVAEESKKGEGRLNDGFFLHDLKQAKLSGKFPGYTDSFGARTIYPYGNASYLFGSAFTEYIIEKYGMDKYAEFWHRGINSNRLTSTAVFKKTYGISMKKEWKNFYNSIDVEGIDKDPSTIKGIVKSKFNNKGLHLYSVLGTSGGKDAILDKTTCSVYLGKKKLFTKTNLISANMSHDGKYIAVTFLDTNHPNKKVRASYLNLKTGRWKTLDGTGIKHLCIFENNGREYIAAIKNISQKCTLEIKNLDKDSSPVCSFDFLSGEIPYSLKGDSNGNLWFFLKKEMNFSLCRATLADGKTEIHEFNLENLKPESLSIHDENVGKTTVLFSYVEHKSFPRLAMAEIIGDEMKLALLQKDISGGIYSPVMKDGNILYAARFYTEGTIYELNLDEFQTECISSTTAISSTTYGKQMASSVPEKENNDDFSFSEYKKILYPKQTIVPVSILSSYYISPSVYYTDEEDCLSLPSPYLLGATVIKNNPWDTKHIALTAGYNPSKKAGGAGLSFIGNTSSKNFTLTDTVNSIFDKDGFMQANNSFNCSTEISTGNISRIIFTESNIFLYGKEDMDEKTADRYRLNDEQLSRNYIYDKNTVSLHYSTMHRTGARTAEVSGFKLGINYKNVYATTDAKKEDSIFYRMRHYENDRIQFSQIFPSAEISIPGILPYDCKGPFTYNLPFRVQGSLFQFNDSFITFVAETVLFSWEVQKGFGVIPLYLGTMSLKAFYQEEYTTGLNRNMEIRYLKEDFENFNKMDKSRYAGGSLVFVLGGNTGALADKNMNVSVSCKAYQCLEGSHKGETKFLVTSLLNFSLL